MGYISHYKKMLCHDLMFKCVRSEQKKKVKQSENKSHQK
jgi:hypothetical protein